MRQYECVSYHQSYKPCSTKILRNSTDVRCRKKYFSPSERLHIAQESAVHKRRKHSFGSASWMSASTSTDAELRPSTSQGISLRKRASQRQPKDSMSGFAGLDLDSISEEQARWFVSLPHKIRKQHFSRKEQISLAVRCKRVLQRTSPDLAEDVLRRCLHAGREGDSVTIASRRRRRRSSATVDTDILIDEDFLECDALSKHSFDALAPEMEIYNLCSCPSSSKAKDGAIIPPAPAPAVQESPSTHKQSRSRSLSRAITLAPMSLPPPELSAVPPVPPLPPPDQLPLVRHRALTAASSRPQFTGPTPGSQEPTAEAKHFQQRDVRKQLRQYLSPQKFDEALEFGFAFSKDERALSSSVTNQSFPLRLPAPCLTGDDYGDDDDNNSPETSSPRTPTAPDTAHPGIKKSSFDSSIEIRPSFFTALKTGKTRSPDDSFGDREMTIHMTLTRRDLRAPEEDVYGVQRPTTSGVDVERVDPLALDTLPVCDDPTGAQGAFAVRDSKGTKGLKRVWKSLRGR